MKKKILLSLLIFPLTCSLHAKSIAKNVQKAMKATISIVTYDENDKLLRSGNGFFIAADGTAVSEYTLFKGASRAEAIDERGKKYPITFVAGVNEMYDLIKIRIDNNKVTAIPLAQQTAETGTPLYILPAPSSKAQPIAVTVDSIESIGGGQYYALNAKYNATNTSCPVTNEAGELVAIVQRSGDTTANTYAISANIANEMAIKVVSATSSVLRSIAIPVALPSDQKDAVSYLYLLQQSAADSLRYLQALNQFIEQYDKLPDGYLERARYYAQHKRYDLCDADLETALGKENGKGQAHYIKSKIIYQKNLYDPTADYKDWTLETALREAETAYEQNPLPLYKLMQADCHYGMKNYDKAYECYEAVNTTSFASAETFYYAARAKEKAGAEPAVLVALMDSAINKYTSPYPPAAAPYFLERARYLNAAKEYRKSILDYNEYEHIVGFKNLNDKFYYIREQVALMGKLYHQAISDIQRAISLNPKEYTYQVELAALMLRTGQIDEALETAQGALKLKSDDSDVYKILGIAWGEKNNKAKAKEYLNKAKDLGDTQVEELIEQYK